LVSFVVFFAVEEGEKQPVKAGKRYRKTSTATGTGRKNSKPLQKALPDGHCSSTSQEPENSTTSPSTDTTKAQFGEHTRSSH
jgi:hypothetical protein